MSRPSSPTKPTPRLPFKPAHLSRLSFPAQKGAHLVVPGHGRADDPNRTSVLSFDSASQVSEAYNAAAAAGFDRVRERSTPSIVSDGDGARPGQGEEPAEDDGDDGHGWDAEAGRNAWCIFDFEGEKDGNELSVLAHSRLVILAHTLAASPPTASSPTSPASSAPESPSTTEGWSLALVPSTGQVGLIPQSYFTYTAPMSYGAVPTPDMLPRSVPIARFSVREEDEEDEDEEEDQPSPLISQLQHPIAPQTTGGFGGAMMAASKMMHDGVLPGGRNVNRFSTFVVSGAEDFILTGPPATNSSHATSGLPVSSDSMPAVPKGGGSHFKFGSISSTESGGTISALGGGLGVGEADRHFVETGPSWKAKTPPFELTVHSPSKRKSSIGLSEYTIYHITSTFPPAPHSPGGTTSNGVGETVRVTVERRFSSFLSLQSYLKRKFPSLAIPPLPEKQYTGRFSDDFVEARRGDLERWMRRVTRHPVVRYSDGVVGFLGVEECEEWDQMYPTFSEDPHVGPLFYANIFHPAYNLDLEDASSAIDKFSSHVTAVGRGVQHLREVMTKTRESERDRASNRRALGQGILGLITSQPVGRKARPARRHSDGDSDAETEEDGEGLLNSEGGWCWREGCDDCLRLTKAMQGAAEALLEVADEEENHACGTLLQTQEALKDVAHPGTLYAPVVETHRATLSRYAEAVAEDGRLPTDNTMSMSMVAPSDEIAARCETVLNSTMAETSHYHDTKVEDFKALTSSYLDAEIDHLSSVLAKLTAARQAFDQPTYDALSENGPRATSRHEADLSAPSLPRPLVQPSPHVFDSMSATLRPVSMAVSTLGESAAGLLWGAVPSFGSTLVGNKTRAMSGGDTSSRLSKWLW